MSDPPSRLLTLPPTTLDRIISFSLSLRVSPLDLISKLGSTISQSTWRVLATTVTLPDDDSILLHLERELESDIRRGTNLLSSIATSHSHLVKHLDIIRPTITTGNEGSSLAGSEEGLSREIDFPPLDDHSLLSFLDRFTNLQSFTWSSYRLPPEDLCFDIANSAKSLRSFRFDLVPSPFLRTLLESGGDDAPSSPNSFNNSTSPSSPSSMSLVHSHSHTSLHHQTPRWDSPSLSSLPGTLTSLSLSSLSHAGIHELSNSLTSFFALERLELSKTVFVDDSLLEEIAQSLNKTLKWFRVIEMGGTKLSDVGLSSLFEGCQELEEFELDCIEGRLSRSCWSKILIFPPRLRSIKLIYSEQPPHKSWVLDHLQSLPSLLSVPSLTSFTLSRKLHPSCLIPGSHHLPRYPIDPLLNPRKITEKELKAITEDEDAKRWQELDLDLVLIDQEQLKKVLESCTELKRLKIGFDGEFKSILSLASSFAACFHLHQFQISIPLSHTPSLQPLTPQTYLPSTTSSTSPHLSSSPSPSLSPSSSPFKPTSELPSTTSSNLPSCISLLLPATRDWRRFLKKTHSLQSIEWLGRGGIGKWIFNKVEGKGLMRIEFIPTLPTNALTTDEGLGVGGGLVGRREREDSWISTSSSRSSFSSSSLLGGERIRRRSSGANTALSSPSSPPSKMLAKGERYGSIDAAFSSSASSPRRKTEGFGVIGAGGAGGGATRRCSTTSSPGSVIGQGWNGFKSSSTSSIPENGGGGGNQSFDPFATATASTPVPLSPTSKNTSIEDALGGLQMDLGGGGGKGSEGTSSLGYGWASSNSSSSPPQTTSQKSRSQGQGSPKSEKSAPSPVTTRRTSGGGGGKNRNGINNGKVGSEETKESGERRKKDQRGGGRRRESGGGKA